MDALIFVYVGLAVVTGIVASSKGRSGVGWFVLGMLFSVLALLAVALMPGLSRSGPTKVCPNCAETVQAPARVCRFCQHTFDLTAFEDATRREKLSVDRRTKGILLIPAIIIGLVVIAGAMNVFSNLMSAP